METILLLAHTETDGSLAQSAREALHVAATLHKSLAGSQLAVGLIGENVQLAANSIAASALARCLAARINQNEPGPLRSLHRRFHPLPVIPAVDRNPAIVTRYAGNMHISASAESLRHSGNDAVPPRSGRSNDEGCDTGLANGFGCRRVGGIARLTEILADDTEILCGWTASDGIRRRLNIFTS